MLSDYNDLQIFIPYEAPNLESGDRYDLKFYLALYDKDEMMRTIRALSLLFTGGVLLVFGSAHQALGWSQTSDQLRTPMENSPERQAILDAVREEYKGDAGHPSQFKVNYLKVHHGWAWIDVTPLDVDGKQVADPAPLLFYNDQGKMLFLMSSNVTEVNASALAQTSAIPDLTVRQFYEWYLHALNQNGDPLQKQAELSKFVTRRLIKSLNRVLRSPEGLDADFFIDAQDWDPLWEKNISVSKARIQGLRANVSVTLKGGAGFGNHKLQVGLRKEGGVWKIDSINGGRNP